jgi:hypothetical protein
LNLLKLEAWEFIQRFVLVKEVMIWHLSQRRMSAHGTNAKFGFERKAEVRPAAMKIAYPK